MITLTWSEIKGIIDSGIGFNFHEEELKIIIHCCNGGINYECTLFKNEVNKLDPLREEIETADYAEFNLSYRSKVSSVIETFYSREPFATKQLKDGSKLFRRKHGVLFTALANSETTYLFNIPYDNCKINKLEVIDANPLDQVDLIVLDTPTGAISTVPNYQLNQFGFDVVVSELLYSDKSDYDADLIKDMKIKIVYKNRRNTDKEIGINVVLHQLIK